MHEITKISRLRTNGVLLIVTKNRFSPYDQAVLDDPAYETKPGPVSGFISDVIYGADSRTRTTTTNRSKQTITIKMLLKHYKEQSMRALQDNQTYRHKIQVQIKERLDEAGYVFEPFKKVLVVYQFILGGQKS